MLQHFPIRRLQQIWAIRRAASRDVRAGGEDNGFRRHFGHRGSGKNILRLLLSGYFYGSFLLTFVCWGAWRRISLATGRDFWEATRGPEASLIG